MRELSPTGKKNLTVVCIVMMVVTDVLLLAVCLLIGVPSKGASAGLIAAHVFRKMLPVLAVNWAIGFMFINLWLIRIRRLNFALSVLLKSAIAAGFAGCIAWQNLHWLSVVGLATMLILILAPLIAAEVRIGVFQPAESRL